MFLYVKCFVYVFYSAHFNKLLRETLTFQGFQMKKWRLRRLITSPRSHSEVAGLEVGWVSMLNYFLML